MLSCYICLLCLVVRAGIMNKFIVFSINVLMIPVLSVLVLGPVISCGGATPQGVDKTKEEEMSCDDVYADKIKSTSETKTRVGVETYGLEYDDGNLEIS